MSLRIMGQAATTMNQLQKKLDVIGHNLANSETNGYKTRTTEFGALLFQQINNLNDPENARGRITPDGIRVGTGARLGAINNNLAIGAMKTTGRELDTMLLDERHYFQYRIQENGVDEIRYTRDGAFYLSPIGNGETVELVTSEGYPIYGTNGPIQFQSDFDAIHINERGDIILTINAEESTVATLAIAEITRPRILEATGENGFRLPDLAALGYNFNDIVRAPANDTHLVQNQVLEMSNVAIQDEMTQLIIAQRSYQMNARSITTADQMQGLINQLR